MADFIFCLRYQDVQNWDICKRHGLLGVRTSPSGISSARIVAAGDTIYVWRGGAGRPGAGLIAKATVLGPAQPAVNPPWPDPASYTYVIPIRVKEELAASVPDQFPGHGAGVRFGIQNSDLQKSLRPLSASSVGELEKCFTEAADDAELPSPPVVATGTGWSADQDLIDEVEAAAVAATRQHLRSLGWQEVRDCQQDGCGYDLLYGRGRGERMLVEVKGTAGSMRRFMLTPLERKVLETNSDARLYLVVNALDEPIVAELDWAGVVRLGLTATGWRAG